MASSNKLPCDTFTENTVLGLMLSDNKMATAILSNITLEDFYEENYQNQTVFRAIKRVSDRGDIIDITSVVSELVLMKELDNVSESYIYNLVEQTISTTKLLMKLKTNMKLKILKTLTISFQKVEKK